MINKREQDPFLMCDDCGFVQRKNTMFIKAYKHTAICLCKKCAMKLAKEINEGYAEGEEER